MSTATFLRRPAAGYGAALDRACTGSATKSGVAYRLDADSDVRENSLSCDYVALGVKSAEPHFRFCH